jgi:hypothetical protein
MSNDTDWMEHRITEAQKTHTSLHPDVPAILLELLKGPLSERQLTPKELIIVTNKIVGIVIPASTEPEGEQ